MKNLFLFIFPLLFVISSSAQTISNDAWAYIEEFGTDIPLLMNNDGSDLFTESTTWTSLPNATSVFGRSVAGVIGDYLYIHTSQTTPSLALAFHIPTNTWSNSTPCNVPSFNNAYCVANGELYKLSTNGFEKFTPTGSGLGTWTTLTNGPATIRPAQNSMTWDGGDYIYVYSSSTSSPYPSYLERYHITNGTWETRTGSLFPRRYPGMAYLNGYIYMIGGLHDLNSYSDICQRYNVATDIWEQIASIPENVNFTKWSTTADGNYVYHVGSGGGFSPYTISDKVYYYDPVSNTWTLESTLPAVRGLAIGLLMQGYSKLFFGGGNDGSAGTAYQVHTWEGNGGPYIPVELTSFTASVIDYSVVLNWSTASEVNNSHFEIERSSDNQSYISIGNVAGNGTTTQNISYSFTDNSISENKYYYRLKQVDFDGSFEYSDVIEVDINISDFSLSQNYPNPFNPTTNIEYRIADFGYVTLKIFDILGNEVVTLVNENKEPGIYTINFNAEILTSGIYFYELRADDFREVKKLALIR